MLRPVIALAGAALMAIAAAPPCQAGDSALRVGEGQASLFAVIRHPDRTGPARPGVLLIAGSGPTDHDGDSTAPGIRPGTLRQLAAGLADIGVVSLRYDKRFIARSATPGQTERDLTLDIAVDDAVRMAQRLAREPGVTCIVIAGHSEGALIGALAAAHTPTCGLISISGMGRPFDEVVNAQLVAAHVPDAVMQSVAQVWVELKAGRLVPSVRATDPLFRPSVQPYLISTLAHPPTEAIAAVRSAVLILQGTTDLQVSLDDAQRLAAARPGAKLVVLNGVNHVLKTAPLDRAANIATYGQPDAPLAPSVMPAISAFITAVQQQGSAE